MSTCVPYEPNLGCVDDAEWTAYGTDLQDRAIDLAWKSLRHLTGGQIGNCVVAARPCGKRCTSAGIASGVGPWQPMIRGGFWYNVACGCGSDYGCSCSFVQEVMLPGRVAEIAAIYINGVELDESAYRIDNGNLVVRQDGEAWPLCQDMSQPWNGDDAFSILYVPGILPTDAALWAAGVLASEFAKACNGAKCRLPSSVTSLARQGVSYEFSQGMFAGGVTGIREVDAYVQSVNPAHLHTAPKVWSPDLASSKVRYTTGGDPPDIGAFEFTFGPEYEVFP